MSFLGFGVDHEGVLIRLHGFREVMVVGQGYRM